MVWLLLLLVVVIVVILFAMRPKTQASTLAEVEFADALSGARREQQRLGDQLDILEPSNDAATQALADAAECHASVAAQLGLATTPLQARVAKQTALEGLYYIRAARTAMHLDPGHAIPKLANQNRAGHVTEDRTVIFQGRQITAAPTPSDHTPFYYPGTLVAGRPVPTGWYSEPWWRPALLTGTWPPATPDLFTSLFTAMPDFPYDPATFESGLPTDSPSDHPTR
ncbi:DUF1542 domain-containing protein [Nocardia sp. NPDC127579]|uniref:DUF1542 domain-containing protein n=1 Tax=Nocardia sp. NPDC127579 TaxID=3345402 RepID=UPI00362F6B68